MTYRFSLKYLVAVFFILFCYSQVKGQTRIYGTVTDSVTHEKLPYTTISIKGTTDGCISDNNGNFSFIIPQKKGVLSISSIGYKEQLIPLSSIRVFPIQIHLVPIAYELDEITVKPKKEKYSRKNNPAVEFVKTMIERRDENSPKNKDLYQRDRYEKLTIALNNFDRKQKDSHFGKGFEFLDSYVDTSLISGKPILNISSREMIATDFYRKTPKSEKQYVKARKRAGLDDMFSENEIEAAIQEVFKDVDIFEGNIMLFRNKFVSPLSTLGLSFYKYYLLDTLMVGNERCVDLTFVPFNPESFGFTGHLFVTLDSTYFVKWVQMNVPHDINLNFIQYMNIEQEFSRLPDGTRMLDFESLIAEMKVFNSVNGIYAKREVTYNNYIFDEEVETAIFEHPERVVEERDASRKDDRYWDENRLGEITEKEKSVANMMKDLRNNPVYYWCEKILSFFFTGYIPTREVEPKIFIGPVNTTISYNELEGTRLRFGAMSSAYLNPHLMGRFFVAYGLKDERFKYMGELEYSFKKKKEHINEFPVHSLRLRYESDIFQYGQTYLYTNKDNMFLSIKRKKDNKIGYLKRAEFTYTHEFHSGFSYAATLRNRIDESTYLIPFEQVTTIDGVSTSNFVKEIMRTEFEFNLRYAPKEKFIQTKWNRYSVVPENPVFTLTHRFGVKDFLGSDYTYHHTEASFKKRVWLSPLGYTDWLLKAGKIWNQVPFPLLIIPNANLSYTIQKESFQLMNAMEFFNDSYFSWDLTYYMNGAIFNRLPLIRKLNWREVLTCKGMFGHLSSKNRPNNLNTGELFKFPYESDEYHYLGSKPYVEIGAGIENIFKVLRIDYIYRLTYRDYPGIDKSGIRFTFHMQF